MKFDVMDPTFLQAVLECEYKGVTILDMIAIIDYVDRSTPTFEMFVAALGRLSRAGLLYEKDRKYFPTKSVDDILKTIKKTNRRRNQVRMISNFLEDWQKDSSLVVDNNECRIPTKEEYNNALDDYLGRNRRKSKE